MPLVTVPSSPNGLPNARTGSPTSTALESARRSGSSSACGASTRRTARSVEGSVPTSSASSSTPFQKLTEIEEAPATTCWFVTMWPGRVVDEAGALRARLPAVLEPPVAAISTTAFDARS